MCVVWLFVLRRQETVMTVFAYFMCYVVILNNVVFALKQLTDGVLLCGVLENRLRSLQLHYKVEMKAPEQRQGHRCLNLNSPLTKITDGIVSDQRLYINHRRRR